MKLRYCP